MRSAVLAACLALLALAIASPKLVTAQAADVDLVPVWSSSEARTTSSVAWGDVDNDGRNELIVMWKTKMNWGQKQKVSSGGTLLGYRIDDKGARPLYTFACKDEDLDLGYGEKMMCVADADTDGKIELVVSTRGEPRWGGGGLGHILMFKVVSPDKIQKTLLVNFHQGKADACWPAVGDVDNDGKNEIVIATGTGHREKPGISYVVLVEKE